jgi:plasmid stabilization system protein ParE
MASYRLTSKAEEDLLAIWSYIAENNPTSATKFIRKFHQHFLLLAENTQLGQARPDIALLSSQALSHSLSPDTRRNRGCESCTWQQRSRHVV